MDETRSADHPLPAPDETPAAPAETREPPPTRAETPTLPPAARPAAFADDGPGPLALPGYEILRPLGRGGMGVVYLARHLGLDRVVALKMILAGGHASEAEQARFLAEAQAVAHLQHPNIVQLFESGQHQGLPFFTLEYVPGGSLADQVREAPLAPAEAARVVEQLARGMAYAHARGVVHRDLKPENVLLAEDGTPKVTDFGLAKRVEAGSGLTQTGTVLGTPSYMAPEQAAGQAKEVGPAADIYALGAVLYRLVTGRPPFQAATPLDTLLQVVTEEPAAVRQLQPGCPRDLETICHKCLHKEPARRYTGAEELADDLRRFQAGEPIRARPAGAVERAVKWAKRRPALAALLAVVVLTLVSLAVLSGNLVAARNDADAKRQAAEQEADKAKKARDFLASIFDLSELEEKPGSFSPFQLLDRAEQRLPTQFADHPELRADLLATLEDARSGLGVPAAMLLEVGGVVELRPRKGAPKPAARNVLLFPGDRLNLAAGGHIRLVVLSDLHQEWLAPGSEATVGRQGCVPASAVGRRSQDVLMTFVHLPKGTFYMGWGTDVNSGKVKKGVKTEIKEDFEIAVHDVTQGQWQAIMGNNPSTFSRRGGNQGSVSGISEQELKLFPVETVSWDDAQKFLKKLNEKERGRGYWYRLPTDAEWEYACRGGATSEDECSYHFYFDKPSNDLSSDQANFSGFNGIFPVGKAPKGKFLGRPTRVGLYPANKLGLCDMHGNVWQWCGDLVDPRRSDRVVRGGSWRDDGNLCWAAFRSEVAPVFRYDGLGFRLARVRVR
jgi:formylglycine-generating enzyme required for sulfatase activity